MKCYMNKCINNDEWACMYRDDCDECTRGCKHYYQCSSCDYYMDDIIERPWENFYCEECVHCVQDDMCSAYIFGLSYAYCPQIRDCEKFTKEGKEYGM